MLTKRCTAFLVSAALLLTATAQAGDLTDSLQPGSPELKSAGPLAFGPEGILFIADTQGAAIFAVDTGDRTPSSSAGSLAVKGIDSKIASLLGTTPKQILINDLAVNPASGNVYLSVSRGRGPNATPLILRIDRSGALQEFSLQNVNFAKADLPNAPNPGEKRRGRSLRQQSITDLAYVDGRLFVAGLSNEEFASKLRSIPFPFQETDAGTSVEIFHGAHGRFETASPIRTFVPYDINGEPHLLAGFTCTPLVKFPIRSLKPGKKIRGTTVAELGNRNRPLDMIVYKQNGKEFLLLTNSNRGVMKISTEDIERQTGISERITGGGTAGQKYETIEKLKGVVQLDRLTDERGVIITQTESGSLNLTTITLP